jgi:hypothetical protein
MGKPAVLLELRCVTLRVAVDELNLPTESLFSQHENTYSNVVRFDEY